MLSIDGNDMPGKILRTNNIFAVPVMSLAVSPRLRDAEGAQEQVAGTWYLAARPLRFCYPECPGLPGENANITLRASRPLW
jgi:hypothetical protein